MFSVPQHSNFEPVNFDHGYISPTAPFDQSGLDFALQPNSSQVYNVSPPESLTSCQPQNDSQIQFLPFEKEKWVRLLDSSYNELSVKFTVEPDKGFIYSSVDEAFVCKKKNHFQITASIALDALPVYAHTHSGPKKIREFKIDLHGRQSGKPGRVIEILQSMANRTKKSYIPSPIELTSTTLNKVTIGRLHFAETTLNNTRRKGKKNPHQQFFHLIVSLIAYGDDGDVFTVASNASEKLIVRTSSHGQGETEVEDLKLLKMELSLLRQQLGLPRY